jgi:hypothetical protein
MPVKPSVRTDNGHAAGAPKGKWSLEVPHVAGWLCDSVYPDGTPVGPVQLQLKREGTVIRATLKIGDQGGLKCSAIENSPMDAILALDLLLSGAEVPWETDHYPLSLPAGKRKK